MEDRVLQDQLAGLHNVQAHALQEVNVFYKGAESAYVAVGNLLYSEADNGLTDVLYSALEVLHRDLETLYETAERSVDILQTTLKEAEAYARRQREFEEIWADLKLP